MRIYNILFGVALVASACADRFGDIGTIEPFGRGGASSGSAQCVLTPLPMPYCGNGQVATEYDAAGCPIKLYCTDPSPDTLASGGAAITTTVIGNATCKTNGCWANCSFAHTGGAYSTTFVGNTACKFNYQASNYGDTAADVYTSSSPPEQTTSVVDNAVCVSNGCWTDCAFQNEGTGGSTTTFGNTTCRYDYNDGTTHHAETATCFTKGCQVSCAFVDGSGGTRSTTVAGNTSCLRTSTGFASKHIGDAVCYSNGCHSYCEFVDGAGGAASIKLVGNTTCNANMSGGTASTTELTYVK